MPDPARPIADHVRELRRRTLIAAAAILLCTAALLPLAPALFELLARPMRAALPAGVAFIALTPFEAWGVAFRIAFTGGLVLAAPVWLGELLAFARPAISARFDRRLLAAGVLAALFFAGGVAFAWAAVLPAAFRWGLALTDASGVTLAPQMSAYASFTASLLLAFGIAFELPILVALFLRLGIVTPGQLAAKRPHAIVAAFVLGAILTPPDVVSQLLLAIPLYLLYEAGILLGRFIAPEKRKAPSWS